MRELLGADIQVWMARLDRELENFRVVVRRATYGGEAAAVEQALKLVGSLWWFCRQRAYLVEGREWADALLHAHPQRHSGWYRQAFTGLRQRFLHCWPNSVDLLRGLVRPGGREPSTCPGHPKLSHASDPNGPLPVGVALFAAVTGAFDVREIPVQLARSSALVIILAALAAVLHLP
jgi:hypothetical protein